MKGKPSNLGKNRISTRVLMSRSDYEALQQIAEQERTDVSTLIRRAVARYFLLSQDGSNSKQAE